MKDKKHQLELDLEEWCRDMWNAGLDDSHAEIKIAKRNTSNFRYADDTTLKAESEKELKSLLMKVNEEREKAGLKLNIQKTKIMVSSHITSWKIWGGKVEIVTNFIFLSSKITVNDDCNHEIKRQHAPWKECYDKPRQHIKKAKTSLMTKVYIVLCIVSV